MSVCCNFLILFVDFFTFISHSFYIFVMLFVSGVMNHFHVFHVFHVFQHQPVRKRCCFRNHHGVAVASQERLGVWSTGLRGWMRRKARSIRFEDAKHGRSFGQNLHNLHIEKHLHDSGSFSLQIVTYFSLCRASSVLAGCSQPLSLRVRWFRLGSGLCDLAERCGDAQIVTFHEQRLRWNMVQPVHTTFLRLSDVFLFSELPR